MTLPGVIPRHPTTEGEDVRGIPIGLRYMALAALSFSLMSVLVKVAGARFPTMEIVLARSVLVALFAGATLAATRTDPRGKERGLLVLRGLLGFVALSAFYYAVVHLPLADATVIQYTNPVFTALIAAPVLGESLRAREVGLTLLSLAGVVLVAQPTVLFGATDASLDPVAVAIAVTGALFSAAAYVTVRRLKGEVGMVVVFYFAALSAVASFPLALQDWVPPRGLDWLVLLGVGLTTHGGQVFLTWGLQRERAGRAMTVGYLQIVFAAVWGVLFFGEIPDALSVAGGVVIVVCTLLVSRGGGPVPVKKETQSGERA